MCVIFSCYAEKPSEEVLEDAFDSNKDGAGIAWLDGDKVRWKKGLMQVEQVIKAVKKVPSLPLLIHMRMATIGGVRQDLTHPFPITKEVPLELEGKASNVLMHNGHWTHWDDILIQAGVNDKFIPDGAWSDSRALAWLAATYGEGGLFKLALGSSQKIAILDGKAKLARHYGPWYEVDEKELLGYYHSSDYSRRKKKDKEKGWVTVSDKLGTYKSQTYEMNSLKQYDPIVIKGDDDFFTTSEIIELSMDIRREREAGKGR